MADKKTKRLRMSKSVGDTVRIGPRISRPLYMIAKYVYSLQNVNMEDRIQDLLRKDIELITKQKWYIEIHSGLKQEDVELFANAMSGAKTEKRTRKQKPEDQSKPEESQGNPFSNSATEDQWKDFNK